YNSSALAQLFARFSLPVPEDFTVATVARPINNETEEDRMATANSASENAVASLNISQQDAYGIGDTGDGKKSKPVVESQWRETGLMAVDWPLKREANYTMDGGEMERTTGGGEWAEYPVAELSEDDDGFLIRIARVKSQGCKSNSNRQVPRYKRTRRAHLWTMDDFPGRLRFRRV